MKKILSMFLCAMMVFSMSSVAFAADFNDVTDTHAQYEAIETLETLDIVNGFSSDVYGPDVTLTRAQLCTMMVRAMYGDDIHYNDTTFADVALTHWARASIDTACRNGLMVGYGDNKFGPEDTLTYTQTARVILNAIGYGDLAWPTGVNAVAYELGLYDNVSVTDFNAGCTRAHAAQMIYNAFDLHLVKEWAGEHFNTDKVFVKDVLGFEKTSEYVDGHLYVAYKDLNDKKADLFVTDIRSTFEKTIYPCGANQFKFIDSNRAEKNSFDWAKVDLFVNGVDVNDTAWFVNAESVIGVFDDEDNLIAIYVENEGKDYIPGTIVIGEDTIGLPDRVENKIKKDKNFDEKTSTVTYFEEDESYVISNKIVCGFIEDHSNKSVWIDDVKYTFESNHGYHDNDFIVIYYNHADEIVDSNVMDIENVYFYNTDEDEMILHTWECEHYNDNTDEPYWMTYSEVNHAVELLEPGKNILYFDRCEDCHAKDADRDMITIAPVDYVYHVFVNTTNGFDFFADNWYHNDLNCQAFVDANVNSDKIIEVETDVIPSNWKICTVCGN